MEGFDINVLSSLIGTQGFSVVACGVLFYILNKEIVGNQKTTEKFIKAINNNTKTIENLELLLKERDYLNEEITDTDKGD